MYKIDRIQNRITPIEAKGFSQLGFNERQHLQEWLENFPQAFTQADNDDELLIIQKEFDGFDDTRERLDLLALDKDGNLVVIENKTDDSGRDVVWQAVKYASYCANLSKPQVVDIYQRYLNQRAAIAGSEPESATTNIVEFLEVDDLESAQINRLQSQRIIFVAMKYRKEVTNAVLWLSQFGIACQCFRVTPYQSGEELFISMEQIIPPPETKDFMIGMVAKEQEEKSADNEVKQRHVLRLAFWEKALEALKLSGACKLFDNISPSKDHWLSAGSGVRSMSYTMIFSKNEIRVDYNIQRSDTLVNDFAFEFLAERKEFIEQAFGAPLEWLPLPTKKGCRIQYAKPVDGYDKGTWDESVRWLVEHITRLEMAFRDPLKELNAAIKAKFPHS